MSIVNQVVELAHRIKNDAKALAVMSNWLGEGLTPVPQPVAEIRASICSKCPNNQVHRMRIEELTAEMVRKQMELKSLMQIRTSLDSRLYVCGSTRDFPGCGCQLKLKVHVPLNLIPDEPNKFPPHCWQRTERIQKPPTNIDIYPSSTMDNHAQPEVGKKVVRIKRDSAFGDVISATVLATKLWALGYKVWWRCCDVVRPALMHHPHIAGFITDPKAPVDVNLDRSYEDNLDRQKKDMVTLFLECSEHQLKKRGIQVLDKANRVPNLALTEAELNAMRHQLSGLKGKIVAFVPRSTHWPSRTIANDSVIKSAELINANVIWAYQGDPPSPKFIKILLPTFRHLMALIALSDVVVTPDTAPLHIAAAFNKPIVVVEQSIDTQLRLTNQTDWVSVHADIECIRCGDFHCRIDAKKPPCQNVPPQLIASAVNQKLATIDDRKVSVIIPVYKNDQRLNRCVKAVLSQPEVAEVIVALDGDLGLTIPKCKVIPSPGKRTGFGKTCSRGARASKSGFLLFLNDDCYLEKDAIKHMLSTILKDPLRAVVGAQLRYEDGTIQHGGTIRIPGGMNFGHIDWGKKVPTLIGEHEMEFVTFAAALVRRSAFYAVRGFDEEFDCYCEDSDFCLSVRKAGYTVWYNADAKGIHEESKTTSTMKGELHNSGEKIFKRKWSHLFQTTAPA